MFKKKLEKGFSLGFNNSTKSFKIFFKIQNYTISSMHKTNFLSSSDFKSTRNFYLRIIICVIACLCFSWSLQMKHLYWLSCLWHCQTQIMISETEKHVFWTEFQRPPHTWFIDFISQLSSVWSLINTKQSDWIIQG